MKPTPAQIKTFFTLAAKLPGGVEQARELLFQMTKTRSTRAVTPGQMELVLTELEGILLKQENRETDRGSDDNLVYLITGDQRRAIGRLTARLKMNAAALETMCKRLLKKSNPETYREGEIVLSELSKAISHRYKGA